MGRDEKNKQTKREGGREGDYIEIREIPSTATWRN